MEREFIVPEGDCGGEWLGYKELVRCKDCAYNQYYFTNIFVKCGCGNGAHHEDFFCADGERREDVEETD